MDVVINAATSDDLELTKAINRGLVKGSSKSGKRGVLVHISGTQLIESKPTGKLESVPKYDDLDVEQIKSIPDTALHRLIDLEYEHPHWTFKSLRLFLREERGIQMNKG